MFFGFPYPAAHVNHPALVQRLPPLRASFRSVLLHNPPLVSRLITFHRALFPVPYKRLAARSSSPEARLDSANDSPFDRLARTVSLRQAHDKRQSIPDVATLVPKRKTRCRELNLPSVDLKLFGVRPGRVWNARYFVLSNQTENFCLKSFAVGTVGMSPI